MKIKILHIISGLGTGGAEMMLLKILEKFPADFEQHVISLTCGGEISDQIKSLNIPVEHLEINSRPLGVLELAGLVFKIKKINPHIVQTWMYHADLLGGIAARMAGVKSLFWNVRNFDLSPDRVRWSIRLTARLCAFFSKIIPHTIICCSSASVMAHAKMGYKADKFLVIPNGFDLSRFKPDKEARMKVRRQLNLDDNVRLIGLIARYDKQKNHAGFVEAAALLHAIRKDVHFLMAGKKVDLENEELVSQIEKAGVRDFCHLLGQRSDIPDLMAGLDVLASPSDGEAFPNVLGEAMASGVPCAVTDVGDSSLVVGDTGKVVKKGDMPGLAAAINSFLSLTREERAELASKCRKRVVDNFEIGLIVKQYAKLYSEAASGI